MKILVVDGDENVVYLMKKMLGKAGYEVVGATGCESAAEALDKHQFDLVLLDVSLSEAWELRRQITGSENSPQVLMMGTMPAYFYDEMPEDFDRSKYLQKLLPREKLLGIVEMAVRRAGEAGGGDLRAQCGCG